MNDPMLLDPYDLFTAKAVAASGSATSARLPTGKLSKIHILLKNTGPSANVTVTIREATALTGGMTGILQPFTLGAGTVESPYEASRYIETDAVPKYIYAEISNMGTGTATITVTLDRWR